MSVRQRPPVFVGEGHIGYVEELGWSGAIGWSGATFFPVVKGRERVWRPEETDWSAARQAFGSPEEALLAAYALWRGWDQNDVSVFVKAANMYMPQAQTP